MDAKSTVTQLLLDTRPGDESAVDRIMPWVYDELRAVAHRQLRAEPVRHTLGTTALVHEAYLKLIDQTRVDWRGRAHFFAIASRAMRRILVDYARAHGAAKRGGGLRRVPLEGIEPAVDERADLLLALDEALDSLAALDERQSRVVECRFFGGLTEKETAEVLGVTPRTVRRDWVKARAWLYDRLDDGGADRDDDGGGAVGPGGAARDGPARSSTSR
ncbi:MAG: sigma-70 family RNA polymerase sigma factor [Gemmatimonadota bacterium]